jgi:hypothetical protein
MNPGCGLRPYPGYARWIKLDPFCAGDAAASHAGDALSRARHTAGMGWYVYLEAE